ncbi:MAG: hypothetical protein ACFB10_00145 [Salibacteraceae bacterium]
MNGRIYLLLILFFYLLAAFQPANGICKKSSNFVLEQTDTVDVWVHQATGKWRVLHIWKGRMVKLKLNSGKRLKGFFVGKVGDIILVEHQGEIMQLGLNELSEVKKGTLVKQRPNQIFGPLEALGVSGIFGGVLVVGVEFIFYFIAVVPYTFSIFLPLGILSIVLGGVFLYLHHRITRGFKQ